MVCARGVGSGIDKTNNVLAGGGVAAIISNNVLGGYVGTLGTGNSSSIPVVTVSKEDGQSFLGQVGQNANLDSHESKPDSGYEYWNGTSMATPHVTGAAAQLWSRNPGLTNAQIRDALDKSALDLGVAGRDTSYGYGLVQAKAADDYVLQGKVCKAAATACATNADCCSGSCKKGPKTCN